MTAVVYNNIDPTSQNSPTGSTRQEETLSKTKLDEREATNRKQDKKQTDKEDEIFILNQSAPVKSKENFRAAH